jgi:hypothetical protein
VPLGQGSDLYVLVLRVVPGHHARPLLVDGVAYIRHQNTTHPADWQRLQDLFAESAAARQDDPWDLHAPDLPRASDGVSDGTVDFVLRSGLNVTVSRDAQWRPLAERTVTAFTGALNRSPLNEVPGGYGHIAANMRVEADVVVRRSAAIDIARQRSTENAPHALPPHWSVPPQQLGELIDAMQIVQFGVILHRASRHGEGCGAVTGRGVCGAARRRRGRRRRRQ